MKYLLVSKYISNPTIKIKTKDLNPLIQIPFIKSEVGSLIATPSIASDRSCVGAPHITAPPTNLTQGEAKPHIATLPSKIFNFDQGSSTVPLKVVNERALWSPCEGPSEGPMSTVVTQSGPHLGPGVPVVPPAGVGPEPPDVLLALLSRNKALEGKNSLNQLYVRILIIFLSILEFVGISLKI